MSTAKPTVYIVDDDVSVREGLASLIRYAGFQPETFTTAMEFLAYPRRPGSCCLVLDVTLPGLDGLELQKRVADRNDMPIIFITGHGDIPMSVRAIKAGAVEFLTKPFRNEVLLGAIRLALERSNAAICQEEATRKLRERYASLTPREREVMALVVTGLLNKQIAHRLGVREITVKVHRGSAMRKMNARSLAQLVNLAAALNLGQQPEVRSDSR